MKKATLIAAALICAYLFVAGIASAQHLKPKQDKAPAPLAQAQVTWAKQTPHPPNPTVRTPVAGYSPNFAAPQPATRELLKRDANRLIRWQGWLDIDPFSVSVLNQMQKRLGADIQLGSYTIEEPAIAEAVAKASADNPTFKMNPNLEIGNGQLFEGDKATFYVWTYRHNFTDKGLYQLYVSVKGKMDIGEGWIKVPIQEERVLHNDIQSLYYEFGNLGLPGGVKKVWGTVYADVEIWRGAVVHVNHKGELLMAGREDLGDWALKLTPEDESREVGVQGGLKPLNEGPYVHVPVNYDPVSRVNYDPVSLWERAPSLIGNPNYDPRRATGAAFVEPLERAITIGENSLQKQAGDVQRRVNTVTPFRFRAR